MSVAEVMEGIAMMRAGYATLAAAPLDALSAPQLLSVLDELETLSCQLPTQRHRTLTRLQAQTTANELGAKSWRDVLAVRHRLSTREARQRLEEAADLAPRAALTGEALAPILPATAAAQHFGLITTEHVNAIRDGMKHLPGFVDAATRGRIEVDWVRHAVGVGPKALTDTITRTLFELDQDGPLPDDQERQRRRSATLGPQGRDLMSKFGGQITPELRAILDVLFAKFAAPGMCNPADEHPCLSGTPNQTQIDNDQRTSAQRQHDALIAMGRLALSGDLGSLNGIPVTVLVRTTLQEMQTRAGIAVSGGGTVIPLPDLLAMLARGPANHYLAVFDGATGAAMDLFRARRTASQAQRLMLIARDGGCTKPECTVGPYGCQCHHVTQDWAAGGNTNVDDMGLACPADNRLVEPGRWTTHMNDAHQPEWHPPPALDTGQTRINHHHQPHHLTNFPDDGWTPEHHARQRGLLPPDQTGDDETPPDTTAPEQTAPEQTAPEPGLLRDPAAPDTTAPHQTLNDPTPPEQTANNETPPDGRTARGSPADHHPE